MTTRPMARWAAAPLLALLLTGVGSATRAQAAGGPVTQYVLVPTPIAPQHSLAPGATVTVTLTAFNSTGGAVSGASVFLTLSSTAAGGTATVGTVALTKGPLSFTTDSHGRIVITYTAGTAAAGKDTINAENATSSPTVTATDAYIYSAVTDYVFNPKPMAPTGSLTAGQSITVTVTAKGLTGAPLAGVKVLLLFRGAGTAVVGSTILTGKATTVLTDSNGQISIVYTAPTTLPAHGVFGKITAEDTGHQPSIQRNDSYTY